MNQDAQQQAIQKLRDQQFNNSQEQLRLGAFETTHDTEENFRSQIKAIPSLTFQDEKNVYNEKNDTNYVTRRSGYQPWTQRNHSHSWITDGDCKRKK